MYYSKIQKFLSSLILFSILGGLIFRVPFFDFKTFAGSVEFYNLVSIIVDEDTYDEIESEIEQYAEDIQKALENTRVVILPTPVNTSAFNIASLNESLYYNGYKSVNDDITFESKLIGTVLVGDFNLPIVFEGSESSKTILPFTDFEDKVYIFNHETNRYEKNDKNQDGLKSEIWHGVISPNTGDFDDNINALEDYFDKNHDFYEGTGNFQLSDGILNGNKEDNIPENYEPFVFYYDQFRENASINYTSYTGYKGYIENKEDITYGRFTKKLADDITNLVLGDVNKEMGDLIDNVDPTLEIPSTGFDTSNVSDIQTRMITNNLTKKFLEIFSKGIMSDLRSDVHNAGRYNKTGGEINADLIPYFVTVLDLVNDQIIKEINDEIEVEIDKVVINGLSRKIPILTDIKKVNDYGKYENLTYKNYYSGTKGEDISSANQCSVFRGQLRTSTNKSQLVSATKTFNFSNPNNITDDIGSISKYIDLKRGTFSNAIIGVDENNKPKTMHLWGGNSVLNIDTPISDDSQLAKDMEKAKLVLDNDTPDVLIKIDDLENINNELSADVSRYKLYRTSIERLNSELSSLRKAYYYFNNSLIKVRNSVNTSVTSCTEDKYIYNDVFNNINYRIYKIYENGIYKYKLVSGNTYSSMETTYSIRYGPTKYVCDTIDSLFDFSRIINSKNFGSREDDNLRKIITYKIFEIKSVGKDEETYPNGEPAPVPITEDIDDIYSDDIPPIDENTAFGTNDGRTVDLLNEIILKTQNDIDYNTSVIDELRNPVEILPNNPAGGDLYSLYKNNTYDSFVLPVFDIGGAMAVNYSPVEGTDIQYLPQNINFKVNNTYSPLECFNNDVITYTYNYNKSTPKVKKRNKGLSGKRLEMQERYLNCDDNSFESLSTIINNYSKNAGPRYRRSKYKRIWSTFVCTYLNDSPLASKEKTPLLFNENFSFDSLYKGGIGANALYLSGSLIKGSVSSNGWEYYYKSIPSYIEHKSPTSEETTIQIKSGVSPNLPIDKNRYIDFIGATGEYQKISYPSLFRLNSGSEDNITFDIIGEELNRILRVKSDEVNAVISNNNPNGLSGDDRIIYNLLKDGEYINENFDLVNFLNSKGDKTFTLGTETKTISYYDALVFALYWNNLKSVSAKYGFIFENYLTDQLGTTSNKYFLPKNKKQYEISYLGAEGDSQNMYIKLDPEAKGINPYSDIISENLDLETSLLTSNVGGGINDESLFKCSPPDGVPIFEWIPAIMCRLGEMMPPSISLSDGVCGPSLLTADEKDDYQTCNGDFDGNGINNCIENKLGDNGILELVSDSEKYYYNKNVKLEGIIKDKEGKIVKLANSIDINFELVKIEIPKNFKEQFDSTNINVVYNKYDNENNDKSVISDYVTFKNTKIQSQGGISNYGMGLKTKDANIYLRAFIAIDDNTKTEIIFLESEFLEIKIRGDRLFNSTYKLTAFDDELNIASGINSLKVSENSNIFLIDGFKNNINSIADSIALSTNSNEQIVLSLENISSSGLNVALSYPLKITLLRGKEIVEELTINENNLTDFYGLFNIEKSGSYTLEITDDELFKTTKNIELIPEIPFDLDIKLGSTVMESDGNISTNFVTIKDKYGNPTSGEFYDLKFEIDGPLLSGNGLIFLDNNTNELNTTTFEGYQIFRLKSNQNTGKNVIDISVFDKEGVRLINGSKTIDVLDDVILDINLIGSIPKVGGDIYKYKIELKSEGNIIDNFNSRAYLVGNSIFIDVINPYVKLENGVAEIEFKTKTVAVKDVPLEFQVEGLNKIVKKNITILPGDPIKLDLILSKNKIEASSNSSTNLSVELKDRYNNLVFNDSTTEISLEILEEYSHIITTVDTEKVISNGKTSYELFATNNPGLAYFKVGTNLSLSLNSFTIKADKEDEDDIIINGVGENVGKIETFYLWNKSKLEGKKYNSIYTTLLGSNYGDITQENYLAGSLLFEKENRALAVTSLLNTPFGYSDIFNLNKSGGIQTIYSSADLSQDIELTPTFKDDHLVLNLFNKALNIYIGEILYNFDDDVELIVCDGIYAECADVNNTSIFLKSLSDNYNVSLDNDNQLILNNSYGKTLLNISNDGKITREGSIELEFDKINVSDFLSLNVKVGGVIIAKLGLNFVDGRINISTNNNIYNTKINNLKNSILVLLRTNTYGAYDSGNTSNKSKVFYYNDPFTIKNSLNIFSKSNIDGVENFENKSGIGWKEGNKSLLAFSAGKSVGASVQDYMSFSVINLGDPVISLKKIKKKVPKMNIDRKFDSTIGKLLSKDNDIKGYKVFDYDDDLKNDILLIKNNKYFKLLENKESELGFIDKGNLAFITDLGNVDLVQTGDFTGDGYDDIFFVNSDGNPYLLNNVEKDFSRYSLIGQFDLESKIIIAEQFDMDNDGNSDIITLDENGGINIFYGGGTSRNPLFTKLNVSNDYGVKISSDIRNDNSLVYFDNLYQPSGVENDNARIDNQLYIKYPYSNDDYEIDYEKVLNGEENLPEGASSKYFLKSEYVESTGLKVEKKFIDRNLGFANSDDIIDVEITLTNVSNDDLTNVVFSEKVPEFFELNEGSINSIRDFNVYPGAVGYSFLVDGFDIDYGESIILKYETKVRQLKFGYIEVGLFESGETGDDDLGDIILKDNNKNCSNPVEIFRSLKNISNRSYGKGTKTPTCDEDKIQLPPELEQNTVDENANGIPDYIDILTNTGNIEELQDYANDALADFTSDFDLDGVPDDEDFFEGTILDSLFTGESDDGTYTVGLGEDLMKVDEQIDQAQELLNSLNCGNASCFATPLNWAPLAPGNDPVFMGTLIGDGLMVGEGLPVFSALTGFQYGPIWGPAIWPPSPIGYDTMSPGAGGRLGTSSATNFFRLFITPTLTGGVGMAMCFGGPADVVGNLPSIGLAPLMPSGNCIVLAKKLNFCSGDGSDGDPGSIGIPISSGNGSFGIINGNCSGEDSNVPQSLDVDTVNDYLENKGDGAVEKIFEFLPGMFSEEPISPLFTSGNGGDFSMTLDLSGSSGGNYDDIVQIQQNRIAPFPSFIMDWATRQIEEIVNKLTDFPTVFIILPDFSGIFENNGGEINSDFIGLDKNLSGNKAVDGGLKKVNSGIKEAYEFIGSIPLVNIKQETVNLTLPWISQSEIDNKIVERSQTIDQRTSEINKAEEAWSFGLACDYENEEEQQKCEEKNTISGKLGIQVLLDLNVLVESLRKNLEVINSYKELPEKINNLINKKEEYLEQVLCNIDIISNILGGRIGKNGDRFKTWVELYILIKAILKSWQALIDIFVDFESECSSCKNERGDSLGWEFKLIDFIIPQIPVIQFPKWPDIIIDLHSIRAGLTVALPEFAINTKPIILPGLPKLYLPDVPSIELALNLNLTKSLNIPILPTIEIPELPDIPSLPTIDLPDLPPPPKLPTMFAEIGVVLDILKLLTKALCILKSIPIHPEWRAGDQIAFLTERNGYLGTDFFDNSFPEFSYPFLDSIKINTYINLEFDSDSIIELVKQAADPINAYTNDYTDIFNVNIPDLDLRHLAPKSIDIKVDVSEDGVDDNISEELGGLGFKGLVAKNLISNFINLTNFIDNNSENKVDNLEFRKLVNNSLSSHSVVSNPKMDGVRNIWQQVNNLTYSKENTLILELQNSNREKFDALSNIINTEIVKNKQLRKNIKNIGDTSMITKVSFNNISNIEGYNKTLTKYNNKFISSANNLIGGGYDMKNELEVEGNKLLSSIEIPFGKYSAPISTNNKLFASTDGANDNTNTVPSSCQLQANSDYKYSYEGLYVVENNQSYRLFDYLSELDGNEKIKIIDIDNDSDEDLIYFANNQLFLKENLEVNNSINGSSENPLVLEANDNKFYNSNKIFYEAINNASEIGSDSGNINLGFLSPTNKNINNFRIGFYDRVDKYLNTDNNNYRPEFIKKEIIDAIVEIDESTQIDSLDDNNYIQRNNLAYIKTTGNLIGTGITLETKNIINIYDDLNNSNKVNIFKGTKLYAGRDGVTITYVIGDDNTEIDFTISQYQNIEFLEDIKIIGIDNDLYIEGDVNITLEGINIKKFEGKPLFPGSKIKYSGLDNEVAEGSYIEIMYYDDSWLSLDFTEINYWEIYDLGYRTDNYLVRINKENDYYYSKINAFKDNIDSTYSKQILLAPQFEADIYAPELTMQSIVMPIYQYKIVDITDYLFEDGGVTSISEVIVDLDLEFDTDGDGNDINDNDGVIINDSHGNSNMYKDKVEVLYSSTSLKLKFGIFDTIFTKQIGVTVIDMNGNQGYKEVTLQVYVPKPKITNYNNGLITGLINENLTKEPINLYRFRGGAINKLEDINGITKVDTNEGKFKFNTNVAGKGLNFYEGSSKLFSINEKTGKIIFGPASLLTTSVFSSTDEENNYIFPKITVTKGSEDIFYEYIQVQGVDNINFVNTFFNLTEKGIYFQFTDKEHYNYYNVPETLKYNPGALSIYRKGVTDEDGNSLKEDLFTIFIDGRINTLNSDYTLEYDSYGDYIVLKLMHISGEIGRVLFLVDSDYIMK